ncbi:MAG: hypothetical protein HYU66_07255 [Armatimonadetes bacterium]|nr:hypothetical protein [Armatimonadota bacterium]
MRTALPCVLPFLACLATAPPAPGQTGRPAVLLLPGNNQPDFPYLTELHGKGFDLDYGLLRDKPLTWERLKQFNCVVLTALPLPEAAPHAGHPWQFPPWRDEFLALLDRFLDAGGGVLVLLNTAETNTSPAYENHNLICERWGARLPLEGLDDPVTATRHPHSGSPFLYTDRILPSPVSQNVRGIWFPIAHHSGNSNFETYGQALDVDDAWTVVVRGGEGSYSEALKPGFALRDNEHFTPYQRPGRTPSPPLYAVRELGGGRLGLAVLNEVFHLTSGTSWAHDRVMLGRGMARRPGDFNVLLENTLRWLAQPSLDRGALGGHPQDPLLLKHPHFRKAPSEFFPEFDSYQNPVPPGKVFRGLVGAQTAWSGGTGTVADYAAAARRAKLDFVVFLDEFSTLTPDELKRLEQDCRDHSSADLVLIPGYTMRTNLGNHLFFFGDDPHYPTPTQLSGPAHDQLRVQCFDADGKLTYNDEDAKNLLWYETSGRRNIGYFDFAGSSPGSVPVRNLRLYGMLGLITYRGGQLVEDVTPDYLQLTPQGNPPRLCVVDIVRSPAELEAAVRDGHYLTHVAAYQLGDVMSKMVYGHQYGRDNTYPSSGPRIHAWSGTFRVLTYAGEPFVTARYRIPWLLQLSSDIGLREVRILCDGRPWRRIDLHGVKEYRQVFEWCFDRQRGLVVEVFDTAGGRAVSTSFETWTDPNAMSWCSDRQNGELWHGPFVINSAWQSGVLSWYSIGQTWDGGGALTPFAGINFRTHPGLTDKDGRSESMPGGLPRPMEGYTRATCVDDSVRNLAGEAFSVYADGVVANAYHTLGPIRPAEQATFAVRRTMYLPRVTGPLLDWHAMWSERAGGGVALFEGEATLKKDLELGQILIGTLSLVNFDDRERLPLWAVRRDSDSVPLCGLQETMLGPGVLVRRELGLPGPGAALLPLGRGGYVGTFGVEQGTPSALFNAGETEIAYEPVYRRLFLANLPAAGKAGQTFAWKLFYLWDGFDHDARNLARLERLRSYYGLDGKSGSGIVVRRGRLVSHFGLVDLAPADGVVEFEVPEPDFGLDVPLGLRFLGFNPNWTVGQLQLTGYSPGFYGNGTNVWRNLGTDDRDMAYLAVYTKGVPSSHSIVGHPVVCDTQELVIEVTHLSDKPQRWHIAVNNPADRPLKTVLRKNLDLPGLGFADTPVELPAGAYQVVYETP